MNNYEKHPLMRYELVDTITGKPVAIDYAKLQDCLSKYTYVTLEEIYHMEDIRELNANLDKIKKNQNSLKYAIEGLAMDLQEVFSYVEEKEDED